MLCLVNRLRCICLFNEVKCLYSTQHEVIESSPTWVMDILHYPATRFFYLLVLSSIDPTVFVHSGNAHLLFGLYW